MIQGIQMAKEVAQKELFNQKALYEERIQALEKELVNLANTPAYYFCLFKETNWYLSHNVFLNLQLLVVYLHLQWVKRKTNCVFLLKNLFEDQDLV